MTMPGSVRSERSRDMLNARHATRHRIGTAPACISSTKLTLE